MLGTNVLEAACERISFTFDHFNKIYISFSGGKDSSVMTHLVMDEAIKRKRKVGLLFIDMEAQYKLSIDHVKNIYNKYREHIIPFWVSVPLILQNAVSQYEPRWYCWEPAKKDLWVRPPDEDYSITDPALFPFYRENMEFEEFVPEFGKWFADGEPCACFVGIRSAESLHRYSTISSQTKEKYQNKKWTTLVDEKVYNIYPIYDWQTKDIWIYNAREKKEYNHIYDLMQQAGVSIHQQRLCQPFGVDQRKGLWLYHILEPETWAKLIARVNGANSGAEFVQYSGNVSGQIKITLPEGHTWESFARLILKSMPKDLADHYDDKICQFISWWHYKGVWYDEQGDFHLCGGHYGQTIPDAAPPALEASRKAPSWRRICKTLLRNDYWCKGLSFTQTDSHAYQRYKKLMKARKSTRGWNVLWI